MALSLNRAVLDGAMGTELIGRGLSGCPEAWNVDRPDIIKGIHTAYVDAGAKLLLTNTFGANRVRLSTFRRSDTRALNLAGGLVAREVRPTGVLVAGDVGPTGLIPPPEGRTDLNELEDVFAEQAAVLAEAGVDLLWVETMIHPKEARAAMRGMRAGAPGLRIAALMSCDRRPGGGFTTPRGATADAMLAVFLEEEADAVGVNCTLAPAAMLDLVRHLRTKSDKPLLVRPTATPPSAPAVSPDTFAAGALALLAAGATAVGGCCGAGPAHIAATAAAVAAAPGSLDDLNLP
jgi:5-methyltetrahydrofolate--homocysteine methyltransferase